MNVETSARRHTDEGAVEPSLVYNGKSRTWSTWSRQQKGIYSRLTSFMVERMGAGDQLFRVDFTSAPGSDARKLTKHHREIRRRVKREYGYDVKHFQVETREGHGVLHCVWAINSEKAVYIHQAWLSAEWLKIHGAHRVWIKRISSKQHCKNASRYLASQYLAGQNVIRRQSYAWRSCKVALGRGWAQFKRLVNGYRPVLWHEKLYGRIIEVRDRLAMRDLVAGWRDLIEFGWCICDGHVYQIEDRSVIERRIYETCEGNLTGWSDECIV